MRIRAGGENGDSANLADRAAHLAGRVRDTVRDGLNQAGDVIDDRTGLTAAVRQRPLAALGIAFAAGFAIAAVTEPSERNWALERARRQLRTAIISGLTGIIASEVRSLLGSDPGLGDLVGSFLDDAGEDDHLDDLDY